MIKANFTDYLIVNSKGVVFLFQKNQKDKIIYKMYSENIDSHTENYFCEDRVHTYTAVIDEKDNIFVVLVTQLGQLILYTYNNFSWTMDIITSFDNRVNHYNQIEVLIVKDRLNIIYNYSNLSYSNIWTIQHMVYGSTLEQRHNITRYVSKGDMEPFRLDSDINGNIHLLFSNNSTIYYNSYNPYMGKWNKTPTKISTEEGIHNAPSLLVDTRNNIHCLWVKQVKNKNLIMYQRMNSKGKDQYTWKQINLPYFLSSEFTPLIFEENKILKILYLNNGNIGYIYSSDYGTKWHQGELVVPLDLSHMVVNISRSFQENFKARNLILDFSHEFSLPFSNSIEIHHNPMVLVEEQDLDVKLEVKQIPQVDIIDENINFKDDNPYNEIRENQEQLNLILDKSIRELAFLREEVRELNQIIEDIQLTKAENPGFFARLFGFSKD